MPVYPESIESIMAKGNRAHKTKAEIKQRRASEQRIRQALEGAGDPPEVLNTTQKAKYCRYARQLEKIGFTALDADCLTRYIIAQDLYVACTRKSESADDIAEVSKYAGMAGKFFDQAHRCAIQLGLTPISRLKIKLPDPEEDEL